VETTTKITLNTYSIARPNNKSEYRQYHANTVVLLDLVSTIYWC